MKIIQPPDAAKAGISQTPRPRAGILPAWCSTSSRIRCRAAPEPEYLPPTSHHQRRHTGRHRAAAVPRSRVGQGRAYYLPRDSRQVVALATGSHTRLNLLQIAPLWYWMQNFGAQAKRSGPDTVDWTYAADAMMRSAKAAGIFDRDLIRTRRVVG